MPGRHRPELLTWGCWTRETRSRCARSATCTINTTDSETYNAQGAASWSRPAVGQTRTSANGSSSNTTLRTNVAARATNEGALPAGPVGCPGTAAELAHASFLPPSGCSESAGWTFIPLSLGAQRFGSTLGCTTAESAFTPLCLRPFSRSCVLQVRHSFRPR